MAEQGWFDPEHYRAQVPPALASRSATWLQRHYRREGWQQGLAPHPLFDPRFYGQRCLERGIPLSGSPLNHFLTWGWSLELWPSALFAPGWMRRQQRQLQARSAPSLATIHPAGAAALHIQAQHGAAAAQQLAQWLVSGIPEPQQRTLAHWAEQRLPAVPPPRGTGPIRLQLLGASSLEWPAHAWIQWLPLQRGHAQLHLEEQPRSATADPPSWGLLLEPLPQGAALVQALADWACCDQLWIPAPLIDRQQLACLRALGVAATVLEPTGRPNGWLDATQAQPKPEAPLGLPEPTALAPGVLCLGPSHAANSWSAPLPERMWHLPGFQQLQLSSTAAARQLASWLQQAKAQADLQLVWLNPAALEVHCRAWQALQGPLPVHHYNDPITPTELVRLLDPSTAQLSLPPTPQPSLEVLFDQGHAGSPEASLCISLYNYAHTIETALDSCAAQDVKALELIVVDDHSQDGGEQRVLHWLSQHGGRFTRARLLRHHRNSGLAAARNSAFAAAEAPWCFVLDADNSIDADALRSCLAVAASAAPSVAVVHPLIRSRGGWHGVGSWQRERLLHGNTIDAMALVRRQAWQQVGGYRPIPGGWEDYDFWCLLVDAQFSGVLCPRPVATYNVHGNSMLASCTNGDQQRLSQLMQRLHPWLDLPLSQG
jgi:hypothetical protein